MELSDEEIEKIAHRQASVYKHRSDPSECSYGFMRHTLIDFARAILAAHEAKKQPGQPDTFHQSGVSGEAATVQPCPFCGGGASIYSSSDHSTAWEGGCGNERCRVSPSVWEMTEADAIDAWNTRASIDGATFNCRCGHAEGGPCDRWCGESLCAGSADGSMPGSQADTDRPKPDHPLPYDVMHDSRTFNPDAPSPAGVQEVPRG